MSESNTEPALNYSGRFVRRIALSDWEGGVDLPRQAESYDSCIILNSSATAGLLVCVLKDAYVSSGHVHLRGLERSAPLRGDVPPHNRSVLTHLSMWACRPQTAPAGVPLDERGFPHDQDAAVAYLALRIHFPPHQSRDSDKSLTRALARFGRLEPIATANDVSEIRSVFLSEGVSVPRPHTLLDCESPPQKSARFQGSWTGSNAYLSMVIWMVKVGMHRTQLQALHRWACRRVPRGEAMVRVKVPTLVRVTVFSVQVVIETECSLDSNIQATTYFKDADWSGGLAPAAMRSGCGRCGGDQGSAVRASVEGMARRGIAPSSSSSCERRSGPC